MWQNEVVHGPSVELRPFSAIGQVVGHVTGVVQLLRTIIPGAPGLQHADRC